MSLIGQPLTRREDPPLLTGRGQYVDDFAPEGTLHAFVVRSPLAHARITGVDVEEARQAEGVHAVFTAADLAAQGVGPLPGGEGLPPGSLNPPYPALAGDKVLWAGQPVALVVADTKERAADAAEFVVIDYDDLPAVTAVLDAADPAAPRLHEDAPSNVAFRKRLTAGDASAAFQGAAYTVSQRMTSQRIAPVAMEPRGVLARQAADGRLEVRLPTQRAHGARNWLAKILGLRPDQIHLMTGDVGGGFGAKGPLYPDQVAVIAAARALSRPVKWIEERSESFTATTHGRDQVADLELAADSGGNIIAMRGTVHAGMGAYFTPNGPGSLLGRLGPMLPQAYRLEHFDVELVGVFANTTPIGPYRGAGRPEAAYFTERLVDLLAREMNADPAELRRRNFIPPAAFPYTTVTGLTYETGDYHAGLDLLQEKFNTDSPERPRLTAPGPTHWPGHRDVRGAGRHRPEGTGPGRHDRRQGHGHRRPGRQGHRRRRHERPRPGPRDRLRPAGRGPARRGLRRRHGGVRRHGHRAIRLRHLRLTVTGGRRHGDLQRLPGGAGRGPPGRRPYAGRRGGGPPWRHLGHRLLRRTAGDLRLGRVRLRGRRRPGHRPGHAAARDRGRRLRRAGQPAARRGPGARRGRPGRRPGPDRAGAATTKTASPCPRP